MAGGFLKKPLRTLQAYWPESANIKYFLQHNYRRMRGRPFDPDFYFLQFLKPSGHTVFLDIGANRGQSVMAMRLFHPEVPIVAFEPRVATFGLLERYTAGDRALTLVHGGLSDKPGRFALYTPVYRGYVFDGFASTIRAEAETWLGPRRLYFFDPARLAVHEEEVALATLNSYGLRPSFMKLDVQGAEEAVLRGGWTTITAHRPVIMLEQSPNSAFELLLAPLGYAAYRFEGNALRPGATGRKNAFLVPEARKADLTLPIG